MKNVANILLYYYKNK